MSYPGPLATLSSSCSSSLSMGAGGGGGSMAESRRWPSGPRAAAVEPRVAPPERAAAEDLGRVRGAFRLVRRVLHGVRRAVLAVVLVGLVREVQVRMHELGHVPGTKASTARAACFSCARRCRPSR